MSEIIHRIQGATDSDTDSNPEIENVKLPSNLTKLITKFEHMKNKFTTQKKSFDEISHELKSFEKIMNNFVKKYTKINDKKNKKPRKKCGFALPSPVSDDLCEFMGIEKGTHIARTDVTKYLMSYIEENHLENRENKKFILPDEKLSKLLGEEAKDKDITHFTIQKYINKHFLTIKKRLTNEFTSSESI